MELYQGNPEVPKIYAPPTTIPYAYPPYSSDTMATNYVHSLTSNTPYYYFIPHYTYARGYHYPHPNCAYNDSQFGFRGMHIRNPNLGAPYTIDSEYHKKSPRALNADSSLQLQERDSCQGEVEKSCENSEVCGDNEEKSMIDPRIINILEPFRHLYSEQEDSLKNIFPGVYAKLSEFFKKVNSLILEAVKVDGEGQGSTPPNTLKRSLSLGSSTCKNEWFKVRPIDSDEGILIPPEGKQGDVQEPVQYD